MKYSNSSLSKEVEGLKRVEYWGNNKFRVLSSIIRWLTVEIGNIMKEDCLNIWDGFGIRVIGL